MQRVKEPRVLRGDERVRAPSLAEALRQWRDRLDRGEFLTGLGSRASGRK